MSIRQGDSGMSNYTSPWQSPWQSKGKLPLK